MKLIKIRARWVNLIGEKGSTSTVFINPDHIVSMRLVGDIGYLVLTGDVKGDRWDIRGDSRREIETESVNKLLELFGEADDE